MRGGRQWLLLLLASIGTIVFWVVASKSPELEPPRSSSSALPPDDALPAPASAMAAERTPQAPPAEPATHAATETPETGEQEKPADASAAPAPAAQ